MGTIYDNQEKKDMIDKKFELTIKKKSYLRVKRAIDFTLSSGAIIVLSPLLIGISVAILIDSPGPILFKQKRVGKNKELFNIYKFRTMRTDTPSDQPTHMLDNPEQYITKVGRVLRKYSLDELPQLFNIWRGQMYVVSPRPALWNQYDLMEERDKYGVHQILPGLTGWAQINGRDELEIPVKAKLDGEYIEKLSFWMDLKCLLGTIGSVLSHDGVVEGGTGQIYKQDNDRSTVVKTEKIRKEIVVGGVVTTGILTTGVLILKAVIQHLTKNNENKENSKNRKKSKKKKYGLVAGCCALAGCLYTVCVNKKRVVRLRDSLLESSKNHDVASLEKKRYHDILPKRILITGANSYIGTSVEDWLKRTSPNYVIDTIDMKDEKWRKHDFSKYDVVYHVAGIAHADVGNVSEEQKQLYYEVNTELAVETAKVAKQSGVKQFIFMSSMIIYSGCKEKIITKDTEPKALNFYGDSKLQADIQIRKLADEHFKVVIVRPPMIYGKGSKGNYPELSNLAGKLPLFPIIKNKRSMLYIDNLCKFIQLMIDNEEQGIYFPQNKEYTNTSDMVQMIAEAKGHKILMIPFMNLPVKLMKNLPGKIGGLANKAFGDCAYVMELSEYKENYRVYGLVDSIRITES